MEAELERLIALQELDQKAARIAEAMEKIPGRIAALDRELETQKRAVALADQAVVAEEAKRRRLESDLKDQQQKAIKFRDQTNAVKTNEQFHALQTEIGFVEAEIRRIEDGILSSMLESDGLQVGRSQAKEQMANEKKRIELEKGEFETERERMRQDVGLLHQKRSELRGLLSGEMLGRYDRLASSARKTALARATGQRCTACQMALRPQYWNEVRSGTLLNCESCGRMLYFDSNLEPGVGEGPGAWTA